MKSKLLILLILAISIVATAQNDFKHKRITVFKDGTSFIEKTVNISTSNKTIKLEKLPVTLEEKKDQRYGYSVDNDRITLGSLRFSAKNNELIELAVNKNAIDSVIIQKEYESITDLLKINIGKKVKVAWGKDAKPIIAKIEKVIGGFVVLKEGSSFYQIPVSEVTNVDFPEKYSTIKKDVELKEEPSVSLEMKLQKDAKNQQIDMSYLQKGITWLPTYFIELRPDNKGQLMLEANLLNDIEDFEKHRD
jgi:hypothetical protein